MDETRVIFLGQAQTPFRSNALASLDERKRSMFHRRPRGILRRVVFETDPN